MSTLGDHVFCTGRGDDGERAGTEMTQKEEPAMNTKEKSGI